MYALVLGSNIPRAKNANDSWTLHGNRRKPILLLRGAAAHMD